MDSGVDMAVSIAGLAKFLLDLVDLMAGLRGSGCNILVSEIRTLRDVLKRVEEEYGEIVSLLQSYGASALELVTSLLDSCIGDCLSACEEYSIILNAVLKSKIRPLRWRWSQRDLKRVRTRLEGNKSTLNICLSAISKEHARIKSNPPVNAPPPYKPSISQISSPSSSNIPQGSIAASPSISCAGSRASTTRLAITPNTSQPCPTNCTECYSEKSRALHEEERQRHKQGLQHLCPPNCTKCYSEKSRALHEEERQRHRKGLQHLCPPNCTKCYSEKSRALHEEERQRHRKGLQHTCPPNCMECYSERSRTLVKEERRRHVERLRTLAKEEWQRHAQGLQHLCPPDCTECKSEQAKKFG